MWIMTKFGFFSIASAWASETDPTPHPDLMMIRARNRVHLAGLQEEHDISMEISYSAGTDYPFQMVVHKSVIDGVVADLVRCIDYTNFKNEVHEAMPLDPAYNDFLMGIWSKGVAMQQDG